MSEIESISISEVALTKKEQMNIRKERWDFIFHLACLLTAITFLMMCAFLLHYAEPENLPLSETLQKIFCIGGFLSGWLAVFAVWASDKLDQLETAIDAKTSQ